MNLAKIIILQSSLWILFGIGFCLLHSFIEMDNGKIIAYILLGILYIIAGWSVFVDVIKHLRKRIFFDESMLMLSATIAALCIGEVAEAVAVMLFFKLGGLIEEAATSKSEHSINSLLEILPNIAHKRVDSKTIIDILPSELNIGDVIVIKAGEKIPSDGKVISGESFLDMRSLNGESKPSSVRVGQSVLAGAINTSGILEIEVNKKFENTQIAKIKHLMQEASESKAKTQSVINKFASIYTPIVFFIALCVGIIPPLFTSEWSEWIYRACVVMMVSCPCALVISIPLSYVGALGIASSKGILFKGSIFIEALSKVKNIVFDKTGTLTKGVFSVINISPFNNFSQQEVLQAALCAEMLSNHPIATCIRQYAKNLNSHTQTSSKHISGKGIIATCHNQQIIAGNESLMQENNITMPTLDKNEATIVHIAIDGVYAGHICISDVIKDEAKQVLDSLYSLGIKHIGMLSGDNKQSVESVAKKLDIKHYCYCLLPEQKAAKLKEFITSWNLGGAKSAFVGDGINDSIVLKSADVGISISTNEYGNDISKESADIIINNTSLNTLALAIKIAKKTHKIVWQNIYFALGAKAIIVALGIVGIANMWLAVFGDVGVAMIALLNAMRVVRI